MEQEPPLHLLEKATLRRHFRQLRRQSLASASPGLRQKALEQLPPLLPEGLRLGLYWPVGSEPDLEPLAAAGLAERLQGRLALPAVLPANPMAAPSQTLEGGAPLPLTAAVPGTAVPEKALPETAVLGTLAPGTAVALTALPGTAVPGTAVPGGTAPSGAPPNGASPASAPALDEPQAGLPERLVYLPWQGERPSGLDACGIPAPLPPPGASVAGLAPEVMAADVLAPEALGLLLVPALAIDQAGIRLGSGGGWYDRLRADPAWRAVPALAVLPAACVCAQLPRDPWDVPFAGWLDERGVTWLEKGG